MLKTALLLAASTAGLLGCEVSHTLTVRTRDPAAVALYAPTPDGHRRMLAPGSAPQVASIPPDTPGATLALRDDRTAHRLATGAIAVRCPKCAGYPEVEIVAASGTITLEGDPDEVLAWKTDGLHLVYRYPHYTAGWRGSGSIKKEAFSVDLVVPRGDVLEILDQRANRPDGTQGKLTIGIIALSLSAIFGGLAAGLRGSSINENVILGVAGGLWMTGGWILVGSALYERHVTGTTLRLYPAPPR